MDISIRRKERVSKGLCMDCGHPLGTRSKWRCHSCCDKVNMEARKKTARKSKNSYPKLYGLFLAVGEYMKARKSMNEAFKRVEEMFGKCE